VHPVVQPGGRQLADPGLQLGQLAGERTPVVDDQEHLAERAEVERLYRRPRDLEDLIDIAEAGQPIKIVCTDGREFDLGTTSGKHDLRAHVNNAAREADKIADRSRRKKLDHAREGRPSGGTRPFGFAPDLVSIRADEAALIRQAADRLVAGDSLRAIVAGWNRDGITTPTGRPWAPHTLKRLLLSPRLRGLRQYQGAILGPALWPAILTAPGSVPT